MTSPPPQVQKRGFLGRAGRERKFNVGCLIVLVLLVVAFTVARMYFAPGDTRPTDSLKQNQTR